MAGKMLNKKFPGEANTTYPAGQTVIKNLPAALRETL
jgi:hypothetical protein